MNVGFVYAKPSRDRVSLMIAESSRAEPRVTVSLDLPSAERIANELKDAVKEAREWIG